MPIRRVSFVSYSVLMHLLIAAALWRAEATLTPPRKLNEAPAPIRIKITVPPAVPAASEPKAAKSRASSKSPNKKARGTIDKPRLRASETLDPGGFSYQDFFPKGPDAITAQSHSGDTGTTAGTFDHESDRYTFADRAKNIARLEAFAREVSQYITVPDAVKKVEASGKAFLRFSRKDATWRIVSVNGDPYFRAILYETFNGLPATSHALHLLAASDYDTVRIYLTFSTASALDRTVKPLTTKTDANKVYIDIVYQEASAAWQMAMPQTDEKGQLSVGINVAGIAKAAYDALSDDDPANHVEAKRLRLSPAFMRPIGR